MYIKYWNLTSSPFLNVDDPQFLYPSEQLLEGIARLYYLIDQERIAGMLTGGYGVGKTFLLSCLIKRTEKRKIPLIRVDAVPRGALPLARLILAELGIAAPGPAATLADALMALQQHVMANRSGLERHILLVDEAHYLTDDEGLYLLHFLCNLRFQTPQGPKPLFTLILAGIPELARAVQSYESLHRRIQLVWNLSPLTEAQTTEYIQHHMRASGGDIWSFSIEALHAIHRYSRGIPRSINNLCDTALMLGYAARVPAITPDIADQAARDTDLFPSGATVASAPAAGRHDAPPPTPTAPLIPSPKSPLAPGF
ncbi:MAG: AAA family ATPase [Kiritimatiellae bacterium]|nr:AAA family ATPase [Kiritimatiellia bacterium]